MEDIIRHSGYLCVNRNNTTFRSMKLSGLYHGKMFCDHKPVECDKWTDCEVFFYDRYREEPEGINIISKTWNAFYLIHRIDKLFQIKGILKEILVRNDKPQNQNETQMQPIDGGKNSDNEPIEETKDSSAESGTE